MPNLLDLRVKFFVVASVAVRDVCPVGYFADDSRSGGNAVNLRVCGIFLSKNNG